MTCPADPTPLIDLQCQTYKVEQFLDEYAAHAWCHLSGIRELVHTLVLCDRYPNERAGLAQVIAVIAEAISEIPEAWKACHRDGIWGNCAPRQVQNAFDGLPLCFDKACQVVKALEVAFRRAQAPELRTFDIYKIVSLRPAIFVLERHNGRGSEFLKNLELKGSRLRSYEELVQKLCVADSGHNEQDQKNRCVEFLALVADGHCMTRYNANIVKDHLIEAKIATPRVAARRQRKKSLLRRPKLDVSTCPESMLISLDPQRREMLVKLLQEHKSNSVLKGQPQR
jgi:hypothetical protein